MDPNPIESCVRFLDAHPELRPQAAAACFLDGPKFGRWLGAKRELLNPLTDDEKAKVRILVTQAIEKQVTTDINKKIVDYLDAMPNRKGKIPVNRTAVSRLVYKIKNEKEMRDLATKKGVTVVRKHTPMHVIDDVFEGATSVKLPAKPVDKQRTSKAVHQQPTLVLEPSTDVQEKTMDDILAMLNS